MLKDDPYAFDAAFFNITATEAMALDPRQRIAMEVAYEALENAGLPLREVAGSQTACYFGSSMSDYRDSVSRDFQNFPKYVRSHPYHRHVSTTLADICNSTSLV